jgi:Ser-tRNA(Ala) deacylase AlaX
MVEKQRPLLARNAEMSFTQTLHYPGKFGGHLRCDTGYLRVDGGF